MTATAQPAMAERIAATAEHLDAYDPAWATKINLDRFNMIGIKDCIGGQLFGSPCQLLDVLHLTGELSDHGLNTDSYITAEPEFEGLKQLWLVEIERRLEAA